MKSPSTETREEFEIDTRTGCWNWTRGCNSDGYGVAHENGSTVYAHRVYYERHKGPIPDGLHIDHLCRNRRCVNPDHLEAVTPHENSLRGKCTRLSEQEATRIREEMRRERTEVVAKRFGISEGYALQIARGRRRPDAKGEPLKRMPLRYRRRAKATRAAAEQIRDMRARGIPLKEVAALFGLSESYTSMIATDYLGRVRNAR